MEIISKTEGNKVTMGIAGWLDTQTSPELEEALSDLDERVTSLVFDFSKLEYISSAGIRQVIAAYKKMDLRSFMYRMKYMMSSDLPDLIKKLILKNEKIFVK